MIEERYELAVERIRQIYQEESVNERFLPFFRETAEFLLMMDELKKHSELFDEDIYTEISLEHSVGARKSYGGTAPEAVKVQLEHAEAFLDRAYGS